VGSIPTELTKSQICLSSWWGASFSLTVVCGFPVEIMARELPATSALSSSQVTALHDRCTAAWHHEAPSVGGSWKGLERLVAEQHLANFELWHAEDRARTPGASDHEVASVKRVIDRANQRRNDLSEKCDVFLLNLLNQQNLPAAEAELHSESPGLILDRLSILSLKIFHTREEMQRPGAPAGHAERNLQRLAILTEQRADLAESLDRLWQQILDRQRRFKLYRQLKMYNDPELNPAVYAAPAKSASDL
jgi:hypothetical protein